MKVDFYIRFKTQFGQALSINGNFAAQDAGQLLPMKFLNENFWHLSVNVPETEIQTLHYQYYFTTATGEVLKEAETDRTVSLPKNNFNNLLLIDTWNDTGAFENAFYTAPFQEVIFEKTKGVKAKKADAFTHVFKVKAPLLQPHESICMVGNSKSLSGWQTAQPVMMEKEGDWFTAKIALAPTDFPVSYKYGVYNNKKEEFVNYEGGTNRLLQNSFDDTLTIVHDGFVHLPNNTWKGSGVSIPVFSLKSEKSFGIGEFTDLKLLVDWAVKTNLKLIQILPVNDTSATLTWQDSYPYAAISAFALHPIYLNIARVAGKKFAKTIQSLSKKQKQLNLVPFVDYEKVWQFKMATLRELYDMQEGDFLNDKEYKSFYEENKHWLVPYAAFCFLRDKYNTTDFSKWKTHQNYNHFEVEKLGLSKNKSSKQIQFYYFLQYHLHLQLKEASDYAHKKGIVLKGDIPIGVYRYGCDAWTSPDLYHMDQQAGAPPDDFAVKGQNWGFPTYNWHRMQQDDFNWWRNRFCQMSHYFDAFRIDHILGFFRIWSIPEHAVEGTMGVFVPALPIYINEFGERGIWFDYDRFCLPYITDAILHQIFGSHSDFVKQTFLNAHTNGRYLLKEDYDTQKKVAQFFAALDDNEENKKLQSGLFDLISNVLLFEQPLSNQQAFHFRISIESTSSFQQLDEQLKNKLKELYVNYFYRRQDDFWKQEALRKLPALKEATNMLVCGEDLGMVPHCVPDVMQQLGILSLEIQRMPKNPATEFFHPKDAPYLSVITPSTHDMSTIRGWWEEDRAKTQRFYNIMLEEAGAAPYFCDSWINRAIVLQHLYSPAMWSIFQLQDILGMSETLRRQNPHEERINEPANPKHFWKYRMHLTLEQLLKEHDFNEELKDYIQNSGR